MIPARPWGAALVAVLSSVVFWVVLDLWTNGGGSRPPISWAVPVGTLALAIVVIMAGWPVRRFVRDSLKAGPSGQPGQPGANGGPGPRKRLDPLVAARTAVLAKAAAYGGAVLVGWYAAQALVLVPDLVGARRRDLIVTLVAALAAVLLVVAGFVVQRWCRVPPDDGAGSGAEDELDGGAQLDRPAR